MTMNTCEKFRRNFLVCLRQALPSNFVMNANFVQYALENVLLLI